MSKKTLLFFSKAPMNYAVFRPIHRGLKSHAGLRFMFSGRSPSRGVTVHDLYRPFFSSSEERIWPEWRARLSRPDLYICADDFVVAPWARLKLHIFHGVSFKGKAYSPSVRAYDRLFLIGPYMQRSFIQRGILTPEDSRIVRVGMPKTDALLDGSLDRTAILRRHGLTGKRPVVLYAPTWRRESSLNTRGEAILAAMKSLDIDFLVKPHDLLLDPATNAKDWGRRLTELEGGNLVFVRDPDIIPYLFIADVLLTDGSSAANEYTLLDRPILFIETPELWKKYEASADLDTWGLKAGTAVADPADLPRALEHALAHPKESSATRQAVARDLFFNPGRATSVAVDELCRLVDIPPPQEAL